MPFDHFSVIAPIYARVGYSSLEKLRVLADLPAKGRLLDVGGGTGRVALAVRDLVDEVVIADISMGMLQQTDRPTLRPVCAFSESLPFPSDSFDRILMVDAFHHVLNQPSTAQEMFRLLKPGGRLIIEEPDIRTFGVKLIAIAEKLLLMRSNFLSPQQIADLFTNATIHAEDSGAWMVVTKS
jgi:demethylmenaquinone methyltransferase/2-methoxy-6-polyprenyl-1,4-benzoquinol methylase